MILRTICRKSAAGFWRPWLAAVMGLTLIGLTGCQGALVERTEPAAQADSRAESQTPARVAAPAGTVRYGIVADRSQARFLVFRSGALARLGHNHVIQAKNLRGEILLAEDIHESRVRIEMAVKDFLVDEASARLDEGEDFASRPDDEAIAGTTRNMLGEKVLDAARYPSVEIESQALSGPPWGMDIALRIKLHGVEREMVVPTAIERSGDEIVATAFFAIKQTDFAITPLKVLGGALQVDDSIKIRLRIVAQKN